MSATNRGSERRKDDDYSTPYWAVEALMPHINLTGKIVLEPAVGSGNIVKVIQETYPKCSLYATDINEEYVSNATANLKVRAATIDYTAVISLSNEIFRDVLPDVIITNPPYSLAQKFIQQSMRFVNVGGIVIMLLRLNFLGSQKRKEFHNKYPVSKLFVLSQRPSFTEDGGTDATEYGWFLWNAGKQKQSDVFVL